MTYMNNPSQKPPNFQAIFEKIFLTKPTTFNEKRELLGPSPLTKKALVSKFKMCTLPETNIRLMAEILHQLIDSLSHYLQGFIHPRWCRISSINTQNSGATSVSGRVIFGAYWDVLRVS